MIILVFMMILLKICFIQIKLTRIKIFSFLSLEFFLLQFYP